MRYRNLRHGIRFAKFDACVWFDETTAVTPLALDPANGEAEMNPFGA